MSNNVDTKEYTGYKYVTDDELISRIYSSDKTDNAVDCLVNEYAIICDADGAPKDKLRWDGEKFVDVPFQYIQSRFGGKTKPRNLQQELLIDLLNNDDITVKMVAGRFGSGKTFLLSAAAIKMIEAGTYDRIVLIRNNVKLADAREIGYLPGGSDDKLLPWLACFSDALGGDGILKMMISDNKVVAQHLGSIRGRDIKHSIIFVSEAENLTKEHFQLLISRVGEGSTIWFDGDLKQVDAEVFRKNSGMKIAVERLAGHPRFGYVKLEKSERSETAAMADLLD